MLWALALGADVAGVSGAAVGGAAAMALDGEVLAELAAGVALAVLEAVTAVAV
jgi:hypothetical protein